MRRRVGQTDQAHDTAAELVQHRRAERLGVVDVAEVRGVGRRTIESRADTSGDRIRIGAVEVAVQPVLAGPQLVVRSDVELVAVAPTFGDEEGAPHVHDPVGGADDVRTRSRTSEVAEVGRRIDRRGEIAKELGGDAVRTRRQDEVAERRGLDGVGLASRAILPQPLVRREEEQLVLHNRPAKAVAELVLVELGHRALEDVLRRQLVALEIVRATAAELIGAGLGDDLNLRARAAAVDGREVVGDDAHFLDRFGVRREVGDAAARDAVGARLVDRVVVGFVALAAGVDARRGLARERVVGAAAAADRRRHALAGDAGLQRDQVVEVPAAERHLLELEAVDPP